MKLIHLVAAIAAVLVGYIIIKKRCGGCVRCDDGKENYGGLQSKCEEKCFNSNYYSACINSCMQSGRADYIESQDEYGVLGVSQVDDLGRGYGYDTPQQQYGTEAIN